MHRRLTLVVADAGFGKSTLLAAWAGAVNSAWYTISAEDAALPSMIGGVVDALRARVPGIPADIAAAATGPGGPDAATEEVSRAEACAALVCAALQDRLLRDVVLVLDDVHELGDAAGPWRLVEALVRHAPPALHLVLSSRGEPPFPIDRLRGQGQVFELDAGELAFSEDEIAELVAQLLGDSARDAAPPIRDATDGWPAGVRLAIEALRGVPAAKRASTLGGLRLPGGSLFSYLAREVFVREPREVQELLRTMASLPRFNAELCEVLGAAQAADVLAGLSRRGLFLEPIQSDAGWFSLTTLARAFLVEHSPLDDEERRRVHEQAASWFESHGHAEEALRSLSAIGDDEGVARILHEHGAQLLTTGRLETVVAAADSLPLRLRDAAIEQLVGQACQVHGDWEGALACFRRAAGQADELSAGLAWRTGLIHHLRGRLDEALTMYDRGRFDGTEPRDEALLLAWKAAAYWLRGEVDACEANAEQALETATDSGDPQALAAAHTTLAMLAALRGDRAANDSHYLRALDHAERAADVLQLIRIRTNRGSRLVEEGAYGEALAELELALRLADVAGFASFRALALTNRGEAQFRLGRLEEAVSDLEGAKLLYQRIGSRMVAYPLEKLGDIYRERGDYTLARAAYEEAAAQAEQADDLQGLVPALAGLARVLATEQPVEASSIAERAVACGPGMNYVSALLAAGWVALARGDRPAAAERAGEAAASARSRRDRAGVAEALELQALTSPDAALSRPRVEEAVAIWRDVGSPVGEARAALVLARLWPNGENEAEEAERRLRALGVRRHVDDPVASLASSSPPNLVAIRSLGRFLVLRQGVPVPPTEWQSKKARDLFKMLVTRRGRSTPRDFFMEALWPEEDSAKLANRLSVALSTVRAVLDPERRFGPEHFILADKATIALDLANLSVDVEAFLADASAGLALRRAGRGAEAAERLTSAEAAYAGDFLEEDAYEEWSVPLREEARGAYLSVARALADEAVCSHDYDTASRYLLRILERDAYDEHAHLSLVAALAAGGRHGEARRSFRAYSARMDEIGVEAAAFPAARV